MIVSIYHSGSTMAANVGIPVHSGPALEQLNSNVAI
jgi:hypothetical protein